jgi:hypothetical protein
MTKLKAAWAWLSNPAKAALSTAAFTFVALFGAAVAGWVQDVTDWASTEGTAVFPSVNVVGKAFIAALGAAAAGLVNYLVRKAQDKGLAPGNGPIYPRVDQ